MLIDTDFLVGLLRGDSEAVSVAEEINLPKTSIMNVFELYYGAEKAANPKKALLEVERLVDATELLPFDIGSAREASKIQAALNKEGRSIGIIDTLIAGVATAHKEEILTRNIEHFSRVKGLKTRKW
jgi:tRNA(fMet)-specific endonuclease VapC